MKYYILTFIIITLILTGCDSDFDYSSDTSSDQGTSGSLARFAIAGDYLYTVELEQLKIFNIADEQNRKNGFASEALDILIHYCFNTLQMHQLYCNITSDNTESLNLFQKKGFSLIGIKKDWLIFPKGKKDELMFQLINA